MLSVAIVRPASDCFVSAAVHQYPWQKVDRPCCQLGNPLLECTERPCDCSCMALAAGTASTCYPGVPVMLGHKFHTIQILIM